MATVVALPGCGGSQGLPAAPPPPYPSDPFRLGAAAPHMELGGLGHGGAPLGAFWGRVSADTKQGARRKLPLHGLAQFGVLLAGPGLQLEGFF